MNPSEEGLMHRAINFPSTPSSSGEDLRSRASPPVRGGGQPNPPFAWRGPTISSSSHSSDHSAHKGNSFPRARRESATSNSAASRYGLIEDPTAFVDFARNRFEPEKDDKLHEVRTKLPREGRARMIVETKSFRGGGMSWVGFLNISALVFLCSGIVALFGGYPVISIYTNHSFVNTTGYIAGTPNTTTSAIGSVINARAPNITSRYNPIDPDTPTSAYTKMSIDGEELQLVFSDEFNTDGRYFFPGLDPYWTAVDLHYWQTEDLEWYDPESATTSGGHLLLTLTKETDADSHGLGYLGAMMQAWNAFCFTGGRVEASLSLPGNTKVTGLWPSVWTMGNLGRAGYGASLDGTWPYVYDTCDIGTLPNQTSPSGGPALVTTEGDPDNGNNLSFLPGQKLSACTCPGEDHPGPAYSNGSYHGRSAAEIDLFEATITNGVGQISQSAQYAPFNPFYYILNDTTSEAFYNTTGAGKTKSNSYLGGVYQQAVSALSNTVQTTYNSSTQFSSYGIEYQPSYLEGDGTGYIRWLQNDNEMWYLSDTAMAPNEDAEIGQRPVSGEPAYILANLGMSPSFTTVESALLTFPAVMRIDYIRVYQSSKYTNTGCNPKLFPTSDYIKKHSEAYTNPNLTTWEQYVDATSSYTVNGTSKFGFPKNSLLETC